MIIGEVYMKNKNIYRADDILVRIATISGIIAGLYALNEMNLYRNNRGEDVLFLVVRLCAAASVPLVFGLVGMAIGRVEKKYLEIWNLLERSLEVTFFEIRATTGYERETVLKALKVLNRRAGAVYLIDPAKDLVYDGRLSGRVAGTSTCPGCGGNVSGLVKLSLTEAPKCPNCGRSIDFLPESSTKEERLRALREEDRKAAEAGQESAYRGEFKTGIFVILVIFFWPAAIWYLVKNYPLRKV